MENKKDLISLRDFKNNLDTLFDFYIAAIREQISIYVHSTEKNDYILLDPCKIQEIQSKHPEKVNIDFGIIHGKFNPFVSDNQPFLRRHVQIVNYIDLWVNKDEADLVIKKPSTYGKPFASETEKSTMLKIMLGMAMGAYQYNPLSDRNSATGSDKDSIEHDLKKCGLKVNNDTIRKHLDEARKRFKHLLINNGNKIFIDK